MGYEIQLANTVRPLLFLMVDSADHITGKLGLAPVVTLSKNGGAFAASAGAVSEVGAGWYQVAANAADASAVGPLALHATAAGADPVDEDFEVVNYDPSGTPAPTLGLGASSFVAELQARGFGASLTAAQWTQVATDALRMFSRQRPLYALATFSTVADQATYNLPAGGHLCLAVSPQSEVDDLWEEVTGYSLESYLLQYGEALYDFHYPSLTDIHRQHLTAYARQFGSSFEQDQDGGPVRLLPCPSEAIDMAWYYTKYHLDFGTVPIGDMDLALAAGKACALATMAIGGAGTVLTSGGRLTLGPYTRDLGGVGTMVAALFAEAKKAEDDFFLATYRHAGDIKG